VPPFCVTVCYYHLLYVHCRYDSSPFRLPRYLPTRSFYHVWLFLSFPVCHVTVTVTPFGTLRSVPPFRSGRTVRLPRYRYVYVTVYVLYVYRWLVTVDYVWLLVCYCVALFCTVTVHVVSATLRLPLFYRSLLCGACGYHVVYRVTDGCCRVARFDFVCSLRFALVCCCWLLCGLRSALQRSLPFAGLFPVYYVRFVRYVTVAVAFIAVRPLRLRFTVTGYTVTFTFVTPALPAVRLFCRFCRFWFPTICYVAVAVTLPFVAPLLTPPIAFCCTRLVPLRCLLVCVGSAVTFTVCLPAVTLPAGSFTTHRLVYSLVTLPLLLPFVTCLRLLLVTVCVTRCRWFTVLVRCSALRLPLLHVALPLRLVTVDSVRCCCCLRCHYVTFRSRLLFVGPVF